MRKKVIADNVIKLLKKGYSPKEITERMAVSYNYAWKLKKDLEAAAKDTVEEVRQTAAEHTDKIKEMVEDWRAEAEKDWRAEAEAETPKLGRFLKYSANNVDTILDERASNYGSFLGLSQVTQRLKAVAHQFAGQNNKTFDADQAEALDMIFTKIGRILNGDANHIDSWIDIAGYATLVADRLKGKSR
jgi:transposase